MATLLAAAPHQIRVLFAASEADGFLRGRATMPCAGADDPLSRAIRWTLKELAFELAAAAECVEIVVEPAPELADSRYARHVWFAVRFRFDPDALALAGEDPRVLADWVAAHTPELAFAVDAERPVPLYREPV